MAEIGKFRSALNGFNRQDVADYIAYLNNRHTSELEQLNNRLQSAQNRQKEDEDLKERLAQAEARCAELERELNQRGEALSTAQEVELETYRRAERMEREAKERADKICQQAYAVLGDATAQAEKVAEEVCDAAQQAVTQIEAYRDAVLNSRDALRKTIESLYNLKPEE